MFVKVILVPFHTMSRKQDSRQGDKSRDYCVVHARNGGPSIRVVVLNMVRSSNIQDVCQKQGKNTPLWRSGHAQM